IAPVVAITSSISSAGTSSACSNTQSSSWFGPAIKPSSDIVVWTRTVATAACLVDDRFRPARGPRRLEQLVARRELDARASLGVAAPELAAVDRAPAVRRHEVRLAVGEQRLDLAGIRVRRVGQSVGGEVRGRGAG